MSVRDVAGELQQYLDRYGSGDVALAEVLCDAHAGGDATALVCEQEATTTRLSYRELADASRRLAGGLAAHGIGEGDRVAVLLSKSPELLISLLAIWRRGAVHVPLFTAFGPDAVSYRVAHSGARMIITDPGNRPKITLPAHDSIPIICTGHSPAADLRFDALLDQAEPFSGVARPPRETFILLYTSGTTGQPKGVEVPVRALGHFQSYMRHGLDVRPEDVHWNFADPGWAYGLYYGTIGTLLLGQSVLWRAVPFEAEDFFDALVRHGVTNLAGAPTVYRALRAAGVPDRVRREHRLRAISSGGEPLNAELLDWSTRELGVAIHDHYGQSELGMAVFFSQHPLLRRQPVAGSMGTTAPGMSVAVLDEDGNEAPDGTAGELCIDVENSPGFWFGGYYQDPERTKERFPYGPAYYLTGDSVRRDDSGLLFFASRADDVITSSGYRIGPFEVESALIAHPAVAEVAVIGTPDEMRVEAVTAYIVLAPGADGDGAMVEALQQFVKARLARHLYPRRVVFVDELPRTPSGKVRRTELRADWAERTRTGDVNHAGASASPAAN